MTPMLRIVWDVLEAAKDAQDEHIIAACRRLIVANRLGWRKHARQPDIGLVLAFVA